MIKTRPKTIDEFKIKIKNSYTVDANGCHIFSGLKNKKGYGKVAFKYKHYRAHRVSYEISFGKIPDGIYVLHKCDNPSCINVEHLFLGTDLDNKADMVSKGRQNNQYTVCPK